MKKYVAALLVVLGLLLVMAAPAFAQELGSGACEVKPGNTEKAPSPVNSPPVEKPGLIQRDPIANEHDPSRETGRGKLTEECA
jgi:hypothetical protein